MTHEIIPVLAAFAPLFTRLTWKNIKIMVGQAESCKEKSNRRENCIQDAHFSKRNHKKHNALSSCPVQQQRNGKASFQGIEFGCRRDRMAEEAGFKNLGFLPYGI